MEVNPLKPLTREQAKEIDRLRKEVKNLEKVLERLDVAKQEGYIKHWEYQRRWEETYSKKAVILQKMMQIRGFDD